MADEKSSTATLGANGVELPVQVKSEPVDPTLEGIDTTTEPITPVIPKEFLVNGVHEESDCEDMSFFTQIEVDNTRKCLENTRLIIKDFETQLDWHLQQYMILRNVFSSKKNAGDGSKKQDVLSISQLSAILANHPEGNKKFIKRKGPVSNGAGGRKRRRNKSESEEEEESDLSDEDSEDYGEMDDQDSEGADDPGAGKGKPKKKAAKGKRGKRAEPEVKDEIEEEIHELVVPKEEKDSEEEMDYEEEAPPKKTPAKRGGRKPKAAAAAAEGAKTPAKKTPAARGRGKKNMETIDLTNLKTCQVVLNRMGENSIEIKDEDMDRDELNELLQPKLILSLENFENDPEKPIFILKDDNFKVFDFNECNASNVVVTFEDKDVLPEFLFIKDFANLVLNGAIKVVLSSVFDQHLNETKI